ncbi:hypothetical protein Pelo_4171 [Pelomyxa schiedti]|nr:hypothetical protein Pelo_4171 [Pelomyxa schiedti]
MSSTAKKPSVSDLCSKLRKQQFQPPARDRKYHTAPPRFTGRIEIEIDLDGGGGGSSRSIPKSKTMKLASPSHSPMHSPMHSPIHSPPMDELCSGSGTSGISEEIEADLMGEFDELKSQTLPGTTSHRAYSKPGIPIPQSSSWKVMSPEMQSGLKEGTPPSRPLMVPLQLIPNQSDNTSWNVPSRGSHTSSAPQSPGPRAQPLSVKSPIMSPIQTAEVKRLKQKLQDHFRQHAQSSNLLEAFEELEPSKPRSIRDAATQTMSHASTQTNDSEDSISYQFPLDSRRNSAPELVSQPSVLKLTANGLTCVNASTNTYHSNSNTVTPSVTNSSLTTSPPISSAPTTVLSLPLITTTPATPPLAPESSNSSSSQTGQSKWPTASSSTFDKRHQRSFSDSHEWPPTSQVQGGSTLALPPPQVIPGGSASTYSPHAYLKPSTYEARHGIPLQTVYLNTDGKHQRSRSDSQASDDPIIRKETERILEKGIARRNSMSRRIPASPQTWQVLAESLDDIQEEVRKIIKQAKTLERQISGIEMRTRAPAPRPYQMMYGGGGSSEDDNYVTDDEEEYDSSFGFEEDNALGLADSGDSSTTIDDEPDLVFRGHKFVTQPPHAGCRPYLLRSSSEECLAAPVSSPDRLKYVPIQSTPTSAFGTSKHLSLSRSCALQQNLNGTL